MLGRDAGLDVDLDWDCGKDGRKDRYEWLCRCCLCLFAVIQYWIFTFQVWRSVKCEVEHRRGGLTCFTDFYSRVLAMMRGQVFLCSGLLECMHPVFGEGSRGGGGLGLFI